MLPELARILYEARAEAKRRGNPRVMPIHLARALLVLEEERFRELNLAPEEMTRRLSDLPRGSDPIEDEFQTISMLESSHSLEALISTLAGVLENPDKVADASPHAGNGLDQVRSQSTPEDDSEDKQPDSGPTVPATMSSLIDETADQRMVIGRDTVVDEVIAVLARTEAAVPIIAAPPGAGRTALLAAVCARLNARDPQPTLADHCAVTVRADRVIANGGAGVLFTGIDELRKANSNQRLVVCLDDVEVLAGLGRTNPDSGMFTLIRSLAEDNEIRLVLSIAESYFPRLEVHDRELAEELVRIDVPPFAQEEIETITNGVVATLEAAHGVKVGADVLAAALSDPVPGESRVHPGLAAARLDRACARARVQGRSATTQDDLRMSSQLRQREHSVDWGSLAMKIRGRVVGQDAAVEQVVSRLGLTHQGFDLDPARPNGVFLFVGPTGVGKTELARALCAELFGNEDSLIRLDMSEYVHDWSVSRLIGPQPGYVGYTEPDQWLTTRVRANPNTVILLDEIEKAHHRVWNTFLQVFDAGRMTDGRGSVASFSDAVIVMTSNLGADAFSGKASLGFVDRAGLSVADDNVVLAVRDTMAPELVNRLDSIVVFQPLDEAAIASIAENMLTKSLENLEARGYKVKVDREAVALVAREGYDIAFGARHLRRAVERLLLEPLASRPPGHYRMTERDGIVPIS